MKTLSTFLISFTVSASALATDVDVTKLYNRFENAARFQSMQLEKLSSQMDDLWKAQRQLADLPKESRYTSRSAELIKTVGELENKIRMTSTVYATENLKVRMDATKADDVVKMHRENYLQRVAQIAKMDGAAIRTMNLPKEVSRDIEALRSLSGLTPQARQQLWNQYEGRTFGEKIPLNDPARLKEVTKNARLNANIAIDTYHTTEKVNIREGQFIRLQTPTGGVVQGYVIGILADGRVLIKNVYGKALQEVPGLSGARAVDLSKAKQLLIYADQSKLALGQTERELSVRLGKKDINDAIRSDKLTTIARRLPTNGNYASRDRVTPGVIDKRGGEFGGAIGQQYLGTVLGLF